MRNKIVKSAFGFAAALFCVFITTIPASAAINPQINFQGKITNPDGTNIANAGYSILFSLYNVSTTGTAIWSETDTVTTTDGVFQVNLGTTCPFLTASACNNSTPIDFNNSSIYLGIKVATDPEMTPRVAFTASPYAFNSDKLGGLDKTGFVQNGTSQQATSNFNISGAGVIGTTLTTPQIQSAAAVALTITGNAASTWSTSAGNLTLQAGSGTVSLGTSIALTATGALAITSGGATILNIDAGGAAALNVGATNANAVNIARAGFATTIAGSLTVTQASTFTGAITANSGLTDNGQLTQTYTSATTGNGASFSTTNGNASATAAIINAQNVSLTGTTNATASANTLVGTNYANVTPVTNNSFTALSVGTGYNNLLSYNGTQLISGSGVLQSAGISGSYANLTGTGVLASGSIASGFGTISTANNITTTTTVQGSTVNASTALQLGGVSINAAGSLTNVAYLSQANGFTAANTFSATGTALSVTNAASIGSLGVGAIVTSGNFSQTGATTFSTGTGAISLNGATSITGTNTLTVGSGATSLGGTLGITGLTTLGGGATLAANQNLSLTTGTGTISQGYTNGVTGTGQTTNITNANASATAATVIGQTINLTGATNATANINSLVGTNYGNVTAVTNNSFTSLSVGTGYNNLLSYNGTQLISGAGLLQNAAVDATLNYSNLQKVTNLTASGALVVTGTTSLNGGLTAVGTTNIGSVGTSTTSSTTNIGNTSNAIGTQVVSIGSNANAANSLFLDAGNTGTIQLGDSAAAHTVKIATSGGATVQSVTIGTAGGATADLVTLQGGNITATNNQAGVVIGGGFSATDANLTPLTLDSSTALTETAGTCTATANDGALYYNSNAGSNAVRACVNGGWEDLISTAGAFFTFFGVVPDSGSVPGDIQALSTANSTGPCKVYWATATTIGVTGCTAYSGGRKVTVTAAASLTVTPANNNYFHVCLNGTNNQPVISAGSTTESANLSGASFPTANTPIVCLADIKTSASALIGIFDTRVFTTTAKEFGYAAAALPIGVMVKPDATNPNRLALPGTTATGFMRGVVVASSGAAYVSGGPNVIIATEGIVALKATAGTLSAAATVQNSTTVSGYAITATASATAYANLGIAQNTFSSTCTSSATCNSSLLLNLNLH